MLEYTANLMEKYIRRNQLNKYSHRQLMLPVPKLVVFYNGLTEEPDERTLLLSDAFAPEHRQDADITVRVRMININHGRSAALMEVCRPLTEYSWIVDCIRRENRGNDLEVAIDRTIDRLPGSFVTKPFLEAHRAEVKNMLLTEYNEAETMEMLKREAREDGLAEGRKEGREEVMLISIRNLMQSLKLSAQQAMDALGIPAAEHARYAEKL